MVLAFTILMFQISSLSTVLSHVGLSAGVASGDLATTILPLSLSDAGPVASTSRSSRESPSAINAASLDAALKRSPSLAMTRVADRDSPPLEVISAAPLPSRRSWIALSIAQHSAAAFDAYTTRRAVAGGAVERDPLMRPFANSSAMYVAIQAAPVALDFAARRMQRSENSFLRRTWWVPQAFSAGVFLVSGVHNMNVGNYK